MANSPSKRARPHISVPPQKRRRTDPHSSSVRDHSADRKIAPGKVVSINDLAWKAVKLPDQLDDAEGFYELEEIDDVEVVREGGELMYRIGEQTKSDTVSGGNDDEVESTWSGFEDDVPAIETLQDDSIVHKDRILAKDKKKTKKEKKPTKAQAHKELNGAKDTLNGFAALDESEDEGTEVSAWLELGLSPDTLTALAKLKFSTPTPIQKAAIPEILAGENVIGKASTGSGKTLAFGLPIIEHILASRSTVKDEAAKVPTALILSPTRELAHQISQHIIDICTNLPADSPRVATLTGGLAIQKQERLLAKADIVIGTPGRLWEVMNTTPGSLKRLKQVKFLVADEADRLLSDGHFKEVEEILVALDRKEIDEEHGTETSSSTGRQILVFSATFQKDLQRKLAGRNKVSNNILDNKQSLEYLMQKLSFQSEPKFIDVNPIKQMASNLREGLLECGAMEKDLYLYALLLQYPKDRILVFTNSISSVRRLTPLLQNLNIKPFALHSEMPQKARLRSIERFADPSAPHSILIATDVAARGLDIPAVDLIIHYHVPRAADTYVHRSGRTARGSASGTSIMLCSPEETIPVQRLISKIHSTTPSPSSSSNKAPPSLRTLSLNRTLLSRLKPRLTLSANLVSATSSISKTNSESSWLRQAATDLDLDYSSSDFAEAAAGSKGRGRGAGRKKATRDEAAGTSKEQLQAWRAELKGLLSKRVNVGVSERYLSAGGVDVDRLLEEREKGRLAGAGSGGEFLGDVDGLRGWD